MREITTHVFGQGPEPVLIRTVDDTYEILVHHGDQTKPVYAVGMEFQRGPVPTQGANGLTVESLLAVAIDRLEQFQKGRMACTYNARALDRLRSALSDLHMRTAERMTLGIEGTMKTREDVERERVEALAERSALLRSIMAKCDSGQPVTAGEVRTLEAARADANLPAETRNLITDSLVKADQGGLVIDTEV